MQKRSHLTAWPLTDANGLPYHQRKPKKPEGSRHIPFLDDTAAQQDRSFWFVVAVLILIPVAIWIGVG